MSVGVSTVYEVIGNVGGRPGPSGPVHGPYDILTAAKIAWFHNRMFGPGSAIIVCDGVEVDLCKEGEFSQEDAMEVLNGKRADEREEDLHDREPEYRGNHFELPEEALALSWPAQQGVDNGQID